MKKIVFSLLLILSTVIASAHYITPFAYCSTTKVITFKCTDWAVGTYNHNNLYGYIYITKNGSSVISGSNPVIWSIRIDLSRYTSRGTNDSVGEITTSGFYINIPLKYFFTSIPHNLNTPSNTFVWGYENDSYGVNDLWGGNTVTLAELLDQCLALPIVLQEFNGLYVSPNQIAFSWITNMEVGVDHYEIWQQMPDNSTREIALLFPSDNGNSDKQVVYNELVTFHNGLDGKMSGFGLFMGIILMVSMLKASWKSRKLVIPIAMMFILSISVTSCAKNQTQPNLKPTTTRGLFFLHEVDKNGGTWNSKTITVNFNN